VIRYCNGSRGASDPTGMSRWHDALFGEFRVSVPRTLAARRPTRMTASRGFTVHHPERISFATPDARLSLGTHEFGFARGDQGGLLRIDGELELRGNVQVGVGAAWAIGEGARGRSAPAATSPRTPRSSP
jgi:hypothetical protein